MSRALWLFRFASLPVLVASALVFLNGDAVAGELPESQPRIVYSCGFDFFLDICSMNPDGTDEIMLTDDGSNDHDPEVSPGGNEIVWTRFSDEIWVMKVDGSNPQLLVNVGVPAYAPTWSPDGSKVAFGCFDPNRVNLGGICMANRNGSGLQEIFVSAGATQPDWSPDGGKIAFESAAGQDHFDIYVLNLGTGQAVNITNTDPQDEHGARWSPDGSRIAFWSEPLPGEPLTNNIYTMDPNGANREVLYAPQFGTQPSSPAWSPDGTQIAAICDQTQATIREMCIIDVESGSLADDIELPLAPTHDSEGWSEPHWGSTGGAHQGDVDCDGAANSIDALKILRYVAGLTVSFSSPCLQIGEEYGDDPVRLWGDLDCNNDISAVDALKALRFVAGLSVTQNEPCVNLGDVLS
jgi:dipeptidyl aminopeptidase/acylaminoacyl peptidase